MILRPFYFCISQLLILNFNYGKISRTIRIFCKSFVYNLLVIYKATTTEQYYRLIWYIIDNLRHNTRQMTKIKPFSCANRLASRKVTSRSASRSRLLPTSITTMFALARVRASLSQLLRALNVSRLWQQSMTHNNMQWFDNKQQFIIQFFAYSCEYLIKNLFELSKNSSYRPAYSIQHLIVSQKRTTSTRV